VKHEVHTMVHVAGIQIAPIFLNSQETWKKLTNYIREAHDNDAQLVTWGESLIPGYPFWLSTSGGASWDNPDQKKTYSTY